MRRVSNPMAAAAVAVLLGLASLSSYYYLSGPPSSPQQQQLARRRINWGSIPQLGRKVGAEHGSKWIVVTSINQPTQAIRALAKLDDWKVVVVGDTKSPKDWSLENCVFLSIERQRELGYHLHAHLPTRHYARKNIGYLYAVQHGAEIIYETDDDNLLRSDLSTFEALFVSNNESKKLPVYDASSGVVNPYAHFGQRSIWPRGYPLSRIADPAPDHFIVQNTRPLILQGLANGDPMWMRSSA